MRELPIKRGDQVVVLAGKDKGSRGKVLRVDRKKGAVVVEKLNFVKRHQRQSQSYPQGGIIEKEAPLNVSNVRLVCPKCNAVSRAVWNQASAEEKRLRVCKACGEELG